ncbi:hypothetical protein P3W85_29525 [Cupriavidus basilensis]|uniref:Transmembrane protein n=1 Tax=Cupriavidus basilensis TaxID=68895 RepID=A0ABT6AWV2_9BURK|nr:hypothetical protein [Cupriavidus basilensis]MDF3837063.1 hypothetical protein [Cupriavidus basilensis]
MGGRSASARSRASVCRLKGFACSAVLAILLALPAWSGTALAARVRAPAAETVRVALLADQPQWPAAEAGTTRLLDYLAARRLDFAVHLGGIKGDTESCGDTLLTARQRLLDQSPLPLFYLPGETDWAECHRPVNGHFDAMERLNRLRELFFPADTTLGQRVLPLMRQSDQATFRSFRENIRWTAGNVMMVGLNLPGDNNHYRSEGGRNGEFEDRREANRQWLTRAFSLAQQQNLPGIVVLEHADPQFGNGWEQRGKPSLLDGFLRRRPRDGYLEFKRQLRDLAGRFRGQVLLVHTGAGGFGIDTPLKDASGKTLRNFTRVVLPGGAPGQYTELAITPGSPSLFEVTLKDGPEAE